VAELVVVYWRDIPAQVRAGSGRRAVRRELSPRFAEAIDIAAMQAGLRDTDAYLGAWRTGDPMPAEGEVGAAVEALCAKLEADWPDARLAAVTASGGLECTSR
jgi:hypothetical protein